MTTPAANPAAEDPLAAGVHAEPELACDIVMKGGITSGVIYPRAVAELARTYRLSQVGGASAGAIAAAAAAAAELGRSAGGFEELDRLPQDLTATGPDGRSTLANFFQPTRTAAPLFRLLFRVAESTGGVAFPLIVGLLRSFWANAVAGALPGAVLVVLGILGEGIASVACIVAGALVLLLGTALAVVLGVLRTFGRVAEDRFGMCSGMEGEGANGAKPLTPWLHEKIQSLARRGHGAPPLTFGDLRRRGITLRMMTTNLTRHQPMAMPWAGREFWFDPDEFRELFPADVVDWMVAHPPPLEEGSRPPSFAGRLLRAQAGRLRPWPLADDLPVIVATRMSLSFPVLIQTVRLYAIDWSSPANQQAREAAVEWHHTDPEGTVEEALGELRPPEFSSVWFTDGGLCANLPVHFFDSPIPRHPTFAFNLAPFPEGRHKSANQAENSYLPTSNLGGMQRPWFPLPTAGVGAWAAFGSLLVNTAREWVDAAQLVMPGYRDRIVTVHHDETEGGLNLSMPADVVQTLAERGKQGAVKLLAAFAGDEPGVRPARGWDNHRWIRFRTATSGLARWVRAFRAGYDDTASGGTPYPSFAGPGADAPLPSYRLPKGQRAQLNARTEELLRFTAGWADPAPEPDPLTENAPRPAPQLRLVPDDGTASGLAEQEQAEAPPVLPGRSVDGG